MTKISVRRSTTTMSNGKRLRMRRLTPRACAEEGTGNSGTCLLREGRALSRVLVGTRRRAPVAYARTMSRLRSLLGRLLHGCAPAASGSIQAFAEAPREFLAVDQRCSAGINFTQASQYLDIPLLSGIRVRTAVETSNQVVGELRAFLVRQPERVAKHFLERWISHGSPDGGC